MSGQLLDLKKKIKSTKNTQKITKAMQLVASSKMRKFQVSSVNSLKYVDDLLELTEFNIEDLKESDFGKFPKGGTDMMYILYTSDKGLCGGLNANLIKTLFQSIEWTGIDDKKRKLVTIGKKGNNYARYRGIEVYKDFETPSESLDKFEILDIVDWIISEWNTKKYHRIIMVAPSYKSALVNYPRLKRYLPITQNLLIEELKRFQDDVNEEKSEAEEDMPKMVLSDSIFEPSKERFLEVLIEQVVVNLFVQGFLELKASEYSSRMVAMQSATDSAGKVISNLSMDYNKARQAAITESIVEIISGSDIS